MGKTTHGLYGHPLYPIWQSMKQRCLNANHPAFYRYGGRGITVCDSWKASFTLFLSDMGPRPDGYTLERENNELGYSPDNCVWADRLAQAKNRRAVGYYLSIKDRRALHAKQCTSLAAARDQAYRIPAKPCKQCGTPFIHHGGYQEQQFCSMSCYAASRVLPVIDRQCENCGNKFTPRRASSKTRYCCISCGALHRARMK